MTCTEARFLKDVAHHAMTVLRDEGVHRHLRFKRPDSSTQYFDLITWPGYLCYTGDMGTYVFQRLEDMFAFFRHDRQYQTLKRGQTLAVYPGYWAEKLEAIDRRSGFEEFDPERFREVVKGYRNQWLNDAREERSLTKAQRKELGELVNKQVLERVEDGEHAACTAAHEFYEKVGEHTYQFDDFFEHRFQRHTFHFLWCCYALAWAIQKYDQSKENHDHPQRP